jgi:hypothetical protein
MRNKFQVTDSRGQDHKRTSAERTYTHCVVIRFKTIPARDNFKEWPAHSRAEWAGSAALAEKNAAGWRGRNHVESVEVIPVTRS